MAFIGNAELIFFEIGLVGLIGLWLPETIRRFIGRKQNYAELSGNISWAPPQWLFIIVWSILYLIIMPLAVYRIRLYGNWAAGVNLAQLIVFWVLQVILMLYVILYEVNLWAASISCLLAFGAAVATCWLFFQKETLAGILMIVPAAWLFFATILSFAVAWQGRNSNPYSSVARYVATWDGQIGAPVSMPQTRKPTVRTQSGAPVAIPGGVRSRSVPPRAAPPLAAAGNSQTPNSAAGLRVMENMRTQAASLTTHGGVHLV